jgi:hypothetical protein
MNSARDFKNFDASDISQVDERFAANMMFEKTSTANINVIKGDYTFLVSESVKFYAKILFKAWRRTEGRSERVATNIQLMQLFLMNDDELESDQLLLTKLMLTKSDKKALLIFTSGVESIIEVKAQQISDVLEDHFRE